MFTSTDQDKSAASAMQVNEERTLRTMQEICAYLRVSRNTVHKYIRDLGLPVYKVGGNWEGTIKKIEVWKKNQII